MNPNDESLAEQAKRAALGAQQHSIETREMAEAADMELARLTDKQAKALCDEIIKLKLDLNQQQIFSHAHAVEIETLKKYQAITDKCMANLIEQIAGLTGRLERLEKEKSVMVTGGLS